MLGQTVEITDDRSKIKRRRIKHDVLFKTKVLQKKDSVMTTAHLLVAHKSFNLDKTKVSKWSKNKENIIMVASDIQKKKMFKIRPSIKYQALYKDLYAQYTGARSKGFHVDFKCNFEKACHCQALEMQQFKTEENSAVHAANTKL